MALNRLFASRGVAFVGATPDPQRYNGRVLQYALSSGFAGGIYPVNPKYDELFGVPCYPDLAAIPGEVDVVVVLVGPARLPDLLRQCREKNVGIAVALGDIVPPGATDAAAREQELRELIEAGAPRIVGPVCVGVMRPVAKLAMTMSSGILAGEAPVGPIGLVSQSGGIMSSVLDRAHQFGSGFSALISSGGEFDLNMADYVEYLVEDPETRCIALYAEKIVDPGRFLRAASRALERDKPVLLLKGGTSERGAQAALTHSGAIASDLVIEGAALRRHGVIRVQDLDDLFMTARVLAEHRVDPSRGVAAVSQSGGYCTVVADALARASVPVAEPSPPTVERIMRETPVPRVGNPHDSASGPPGNNAPNTRAALLAFQDDSAVGATLYAETMYMYQDEGHALQHDVVRYGRKPHLVCWQGGKATANVIGRLRREGIIVFDSLAATASALSALYRYGEMQRQPRPPESGATPLPGLPEVEGLLDDRAAKALLHKFGIPLVPEERVRKPEEAATAAVRLGFPVAVKGVVPGITHKNEAGLVHLGLSTDVEVRDACTAMAGVHPDLDHFLVQRMIGGGVELIVGIKNDRQFGPAVLLGFGGVFVEAMGKPVVETAPVDERIADQMIARLDAKGILDGYRTGRPLARAHLLASIVAASRLATACGERLESIDLNPVVVAEDGAFAVDAVVVFRDRTSLPEERSSMQEENS